MEVRGDIGWYNPGTEEYTVWMSSQTPHIQRLLLTAFVTGIPEHKVRCISPDVGGAFGTKIFCYADMALVMFASKPIGGRPVKWVESRRENYQSTIHGRDHITYLEIAGNARRRDHRACGSRRSPTSAAASRRSAQASRRRSTPGSSRLLQVPQRLRRGHRGLHQHDVRRRLPRRRPPRGDLRRRAGDGPVRRRDRHGSAPSSGGGTSSPPDKFPYENPSGLGTAVNGAKIFIDSGNYEPALDKALAMAGYADMDTAKKAEAQARGKYLGIGLSTYIEVCGVAPRKWIGAVGEGWGAAMWESANLKVHLTGKAVVTMGTQPQGQGHETTYAQIISHELGIPMDDIVVQHSDTQGTPFGYGSYGSRTSKVGTTAALKAAAKIREKARRYAAHMLEARLDDIEVDGAEYRVKGSPETEEDAPGDRVRARPRVRHAGGHGAVPRRDGLPRHAELHVAVRDAHRDRRDRRGDRRGRPRALRRGRRRRQEDQPDDRRRPAPRRHRPGRRPGALGGRGLRRRRPAAVGLDARLRAAAGVVAARASSSTRP